MPPSVPRRTPGQTPSLTDLPYGPLPARSDEPTSAQPRSPDLNQFLSRPGSEPGPSTVANRDATSEAAPEPSSELAVADARGEADDEVHFGVAAKALGVSRKTVERMVKRGLLERGPSGAPATVSKRGLVTALEQRRRDVSHLTRATEVEREQSAYESLSGLPPDATIELQEFLRPLLEPLLDEVVAARTQAAVLQNQIDRIAERALQERARDELMLALATGGWRQRRTARRAALRHYVLRSDVWRAGPNQGQ
jgi:hypothetical protein